jgi:site-specific DNA-methyltransferase (adenine-specific)
MAVRLIQGDCLTEMARLEAGSVDMILCDLPYGTTACSWDSVIPFEPLWREYRRVAKPNAAIVLTASQPFTTALIASNMREFKYEWIWEKSRATGHALCNVRPMKAHESVLVFCTGREAYNPQKADGKPYKSPYSKAGNRYADKQAPEFNTGSVRNDNMDGKRTPRSVLFFKNANYEGKTTHPTQKPVALMEYLIRTYTNPGDTVLDNTCGSGTTLVAAINTGRNAIGIERDLDYFKIAQERVANATPDLLQAAE